MDSDIDLCLTEHRVFRSLASLNSVLTVLPHEKSEKSLRFKNLRFFQFCRIFQKPWQSNPKDFRCRGDGTFFLLQNLPIESSLLINGIGWKQKGRKEQFPALENHLVEWVDRANSVHILVTDAVLRAATTKLIERLIHPV